jgi:prephenate dehydrogenase
LRSLVLSSTSWLVFASVCFGEIIIFGRLHFSLFFCYIERVKSLENCTFGIIGMGMMGGAIAMALRGPCGIAQERLFAADIDGNVLKQAREAALIAKGYTGEGLGEMLAACDMVFLCINPAALLRFLDQWEHAFKPGALLTDIAGVKSAIAARAEKFRADIDFIPGHPMAGAEGGGFAAVARCDFQGKNYILTPLARNKPENLEFIKNLIHQMGFDRITETSAVDHDRKIAFTSQLCHVMAAALIDCEPDTSIARFGGGSFEDFTRIAVLNAPMWAELFTVNHKALLKRIDQFEISLNDIKTLIKENKTQELEKRLATIMEKRLKIGSKDG